MWRFRELVLHADNSAIISHPEGNTPLITRPAISVYAGIDDLVIKHEGHNPTGSFKDRGMTVALTQARRVKARAVACASTGNTSASLSAYAAQAGISSFVFVPAGQISAGKLAQTVAYGARVLPIDGDFDDCRRTAVLRLPDLRSGQRGDIRRSGLPAAAWRFADGRAIGRLPRDLE